MRYWLLSFLLSLAFGTISSQNPVFRTQIPGKRVLVEQITGTSAVFGPDGQYVFDTVLARFPQVIPVSLHFGDNMSIPDGITAFSAMGGSFIPGFWIDRKQFPASALEVVRGDLNGFTAQRINDSVSGTIQMVQYEFDTATHEISGLAKIRFPDDAISDFRVNVYIVEDSVKGSGPGWDQANYYHTQPSHPAFGLGDPIPNYYHRYVLREMLEGPWGLDSIVSDTVLAGDDFLYSFQYTLPIAYRKKRISIIPILQIFHPDSSRREILNADCVTLRCEISPDTDFDWQASGVTVEFSDSSIYEPQIWHWNFGDGSESTFQDPVHSYLSAGIYTVRLITQNACGTDTLTKTVQVNCQSPDAEFAYTLSNGLANFADSSEHFPVQWHWDFGDGNTSNAQFPTHQYLLPGNYTVCLITTNPCGVDTICKVLQVGCILPQGSYLWAPAGGLTMSFTSTASPSVTGWSWYFGEGGTSNSPNPTYVYSNPGTYQVCLTLTDSCGSAVICQQVTVGCPIPASNYAYLYSNLTYEFTDLSQNNPNNWRWTFGDGTTSPLKNPVHTYLFPGNYNCCLIATNPCGSDTICRIIEMAPLANELAFSPEMQVFPVPANESINFKFSHPTLQSGYFRLIDLNGRTFGERSLADGQSQFEVSVANFPAGIYMAEIRFGTNYFRKRVQIAH